MYIKIGDCGWSIGDTGLGNRIQLWSVAYELNKYNNFTHTIVVEKKMWKEIKFLDFPHTIYSDNKFHELQNLDVVDSKKDWLVKLDNKDYFIKSPTHFDWPPYEPHENFYSKWVHKIKLRDKKLKKIIKDKVKDRIGIHIRHWPVIDPDNPFQSYSQYFTEPEDIERFDYKGKMKKVKDVLNEYQGEKFYISSDVTFDKPSTGPLLPNFRKKEQWLSEIFSSNDIIDYRDILDMDDMSLHDMIDWSNGNIVRDNKNPKWLRKVNIDDEGRYNYKLMMNSKNTTSTTYEDFISNLYDLKVKRDIVDLFSLIYSKEFVHSKKTGPISSWSDYVMNYRNKIWQE